jgi:hypothetical protein
MLWLQSKRLEAVSQVEYDLKPSEFAAVESRIV